MTDLLVRNEETTPDQLGDLVPVFVYGTLRVGHGNYRWACEAVRHYIRDCTAEGRIYFVHDRWGYPVAKLDETGVILGDVLWMDDRHPTYDEVCRMEIGAGYEIRTVPVQTPEGKEIKCQAFHFLRKPRGIWIESGDWAKESMD